MRTNGDRRRWAIVRAKINSRPCTGRSSERRPRRIVGRRIRECDPLCKQSSENGTRHCYWLWLRSEPPTPLTVLADRPLTARWPRGTREERSICKWRCSCSSSSRRTRIAIVRVSPRDSHARSAGFRPLFSVRCLWPYILPRFCQSASFSLFSSSLPLC